MRENVERCGGSVVMVEDAWGKAIDPGKLEDALKAHPDTKIVAFVHAETSTGVQSDAKTLCELAHRHGCLTIVDAVTSMGGSPLMVDAWGIDAIYSGSQKCLSCTPGLSPVSFSPAAVEKIRNRKTKVQSWFLDMSLVMGYWGEGAKRTYHHTAPVNPLYALHESLVMLMEEGLENAWQRHQQNHQLLRTGIEAMGMSFLVDEENRLPQLNAVNVPEGVNEAEVRRRLLEEFNLEIGAGLGALAGKIWRIGLMGYTSNPKNIIFCLGALDSVLSDMKAPINKGAAVTAVA
jgi:alanine-glyoxylate transaminase/serine-glyoxylate transaminase/serine-pyruvate transaminase